MDNSNNNYKTGELLTARSLVEKHPNCNISSRDVGYAFMIGAVLGEKDEKYSRTALIYEASFLHFVKYRNNLHNFETI